MKCVEMFHGHGLGKAIKTVLVPYNLKYLVLSYVHEF